MIRVTLRNLLILAAIIGVSISWGAPSTPSLYFNSPADIMLSWNRNIEPDVAGYRVHYGLASGVYEGQQEAGNMTAYVLKGMKPGTWYIAVTAYDYSGNESKYSNEVVKEIL